MGLDFFTLTDLGAFVNLSEPKESCFNIKTWCLIPAELAGLKCTIEIELDSVADSISAALTLWMEQHKNIKTLHRDFLYFIIDSNIFIFI
jgi:hypothetical protein